MATALQKTIRALRAENSEFFQIALSVDCVILGFEDNELKVLLIKSDLEEYEGQWSLLGDLVRVDEDLDEASYRVLVDRTGLENVYLEQVYTFGQLNRHPAGRVVTTAYFSLVNIRDHELQLSNNELHWHSVKDIQSLAFDHLQILNKCLDQLREKIYEHPVVFNLLPEKFSLRELQSLFESIMGQKVDRRNFRKKIFLMKWLEDVNELEQDVPHRPGKLYRFKEEEQH
jgi:8-oxo-dGTP diphosphatase